MNTLDVTCPACGATEGNGCLTASGKKTGTHTARKKAAEEAKLSDPRGGLQRQKERFDQLKREKREAKEKFDQENPRQNLGLAGMPGPRFRRVSNRQTRRAYGNYRSSRRGAKRRAVLKALNNR